jgi:hypothetical protein
MQVGSGRNQRLILLGGVYILMQTQSNNVTTKLLYSKPALFMDLLPSVVQQIINKIIKKKLKNKI